MIGSCNSQSNGPGKFENFFKFINDRAARTVLPFLCLWLPFSFALLRVDKMIIFGGRLVS